MLDNKAIVIVDLGLDKNSTLFAFIYYNWKQLNLA